MNKGAKRLPMHLIRNYALFWRRDQVNWKRKGQLLGRGVRAKRQGVVDFAAQRGIYALYDDTFRLVYVGQAGRGARTLFPRLRSHNLNNFSERWSRFSWFGIVPVLDGNEADEVKVRGLIAELPDAQTTNSEAILNHIEAVAIMIAEPLLNKKGGIFGKEVRHYRQVPLNFDSRTAVAEDNEEIEDEL
jgi:hypothetical protein